jgi:exopolysaccharide production protein ExoZ
MNAETDDGGQAKPRGQQKIQRHAYVDALRGYAILGVVMVHASQQFPSLEQPFRSLTTLGARGVQLFFVASALTLMLSWHARNDGAIPFLIRRFFRIAPMFWLAIVFFVALDGFTPRNWAPNGISWPHVLATTAFLHGWHPETITSVVPGGWSIAVEVTFYLMFPLLAFSLRAWWSTGLALIASVVLARELYPLAHSFWPGQEPYMADEFAFLWFPNQLPSFLVGILIFHLSLRVRGKVPGILLEIGVVSCVVLILLLPFTPMTRNQSLYAYTLMFGAVALCLTLGAGKWLVALPIRALGTISYSGYLWHFAILGILIALYRRMGFNPFGIDNPSHGWLHFLLFFAMLVGLTAAFSAISFRYVETPGIKLGRSLAAQYLRLRSHQARASQVEEATAE